MKTRSLMILVLCLGLLLVFGTVAAQEKAPAQGQKQQKKSMMKMMKPEGMGMHMMMMEKAWHMGATSMVLSAMLEESGELLKTGKLNAANQKALAGVLDRLSELIPQLFYPGAMKPEQVQDIKKQMDELGAELEKLEAQAQGQ